ncbi:hypothetical protein [Embleya hyalina]|uniref:hypothetical protein n=1 Tax=Embleya hyalina TaxID=516124 RepID=UPI000F823C76|nr:hypothetical protein [Embleya hyalina]
MATIEFVEVGFWIARGEVAYREMITATVGVVGNVKMRNAPRKTASEAIDFAIVNFKMIAA